MGGCWYLQPVHDTSSSSRLLARGGVGAGGDESNYLFGAVTETPRKLAAQWDKMKINSTWHASCAVCVPGAVHRHRSLASVFLEVLTSDFLKKICMSSTFLCSISYEGKYFSAFFPLGGWMGGQKSLLLLQQPQTALQ